MNNEQTVAASEKSVVPLVVGATLAAGAMGAVASEALQPNTPERPPALHAEPVTDEHAKTFDIITPGQQQFTSVPNSLPPLQFSIENVTAPTQEPAPIVTPTTTTILRPRSEVPKIFDDPYQPDAPGATDSDHSLVSEGETWPNIEIRTSVPAEVSEIMKRDTVYIPALVGCSGSLIRDESGDPIGVVSAKHCGLDTEVYTRPDGNSYVALRGERLVMQGDSIDQLRKVGKLASVYIPKQKGHEWDVAIGIFEGQDPAEVMENYKTLTPEEIAALRLGDKMYLSGWPVDQDNNPGEMRRQEFALTILGIHDNPYEPLNEPLLWAAVETNADGAECSFGDSGGKGFVVRESRNINGEITMEPYSVGALSRFYDLAADTYNTPEGSELSRKELEDRFGISLPSTVTAVCGFSYKTPSLENGGIFVEAVDDLQQFPEYESPQEILERKAREHFLDPNTEKIVIEGFITVGGSPDSVAVIDRPMIYRDPDSQNILVGGYVEGAEGNLTFETFHGLTFMRFYDRDELPGVEVRVLSGPLVADQAKAGFTYPADGTLVGAERVIDKPQSKLGTQYILVTNENGELVTEVFVDHGYK